jgi:periplasmic divalent cation tolerance protein
MKILLNEKSNMTDKIVVLSSASSADEAERIARRLVEERLAACVNVVPGMRSFYRWKGNVEDAAEWLLVIKSSRDRFQPLVTALERLHSYEVPEAIALPVVDGASDYLDWMEGQLGA